jgi:hypothetical protein
MARNNSDSGRLAVIWLATAVVVVLGAAGTAFVVVFAAETNIGALLVWAGCFTTVILALLIFSIRWEEPVNQLKFWLSYHSRGNPADEYVAARRRIRSREKYGGNEPPSVDSVRDAANHGGAWVPRSNTKHQRPGKS